MSGITAEQHYLVTLLEKDILSAKKRDEDERIVARRQGRTVRFRHRNKLEWGGYVFEDAFALVFPHMRAVSKKYGTDQKDFVSNRTALRYELKCPTQDRPFRDDFAFSINDGQLNDSRVDIYVIGYYYPKSPYIRMCGWLYQNQVKHRGELLKKGELFPRSKSKRVIVDCWSIDYADLNIMHLLPE